MIRFYSIDKKPSLKYIGIVVAILLITLVFLVFKQKIEYFTLYNTICLLLVFLIVVFFITFIRQLKYNPYSYNSIYYIGFAFFMMVALIQQLMMLPYIDTKMSYYTVINNIILPIVSSATFFIYLTFPVILIFSVCLYISNVVLMDKEGKSLNNILAMFLSLLLVMGALFIMRLDYYYMGSELEVMIYTIISNVLACIYIYFECMLFGAIITNLIVVKYKPQYDKDYMIILGCGLNKDGSPTPLLKARIDKALSFYHEQLKESGKKLRFICSGGKGDDEVISESQSMKNYLLEKGIDENDILLEDKSTSTYENMLFSKNIIDSFGGSPKVIFSTNNFHVFRSGIMANMVNMKVVGIGSKTKLYFWPNAWVREFVGLISRHKLKQGLILGGLIIMYIVMTILNFKMY